MNRTDLQQLAQERVRDAEALLDAGRWSGAYYLAGYAVECALKACIAKRTNQHDFPDKELALQSYSHSLDTLLGPAELRDDHKTEVAANSTFKQNWLDVRDWNEQARYRIWSEPDARKLFLAVTDPVAGVLPWIEARW